LLIPYIRFWKLGDKVKSWKYRHFVCGNGQLSYYKNEQKVAKEKIASFELKEFKAVRFTELIDQGTRIHLFGITNERRTLIIDGHDQETTNVWLQVLKANGCSDGGKISETKIHPHSKKEGYLQKLGEKGLIKTWKSRYFILIGDPRGCKLLYYKSRTDKKEAGSILLAFDTTIAIEGADTFSITTNSEGRKYMLRCRDGDNRAEWLSEIHRVKNGTDDDTKSETTTGQANIDHKQTDKPDKPGCIVS